MRSRRLHDVSTTQLNMTLSYIETGTEIETDRHLYNDVTLLLPLIHNIVRLAF